MERGPSSKENEPRTMEEQYHGTCKWEPLRGIDDMFDRYMRAMSWPAN